MNKIRVLSAEEARATERGNGTTCSKCGVSLKPDNTPTSAIKYGMCLPCLTGLLGDEFQDSIALLLAKATIMVCHYSKNDRHKLRVDLRSSSRFELQQMADDLGVGRVYVHSPGTYRWSVSALKDLDRLGKLLTPYQPALAIVLQQYVVQPNKIVRSAYAEAFAIKMGSKTVHIIDHV